VVRVWSAMDFPETGDDRQETGRNRGKRVLLKPGTWEAVPAISMFAKIRIGKITDFSLTNIVYCIIDLFVTVPWVSRQRDLRRES